MTARFELLCSDPFNSSYSKRLQGSELRSSRVGELRIVYAVYEDEILVFIERIGPRGQVYRGL